MIATDSMNLSEASWKKNVEIVNSAAGTINVNQNAAATCRSSSTVQSPPEYTTSANKPVPSITSWTWRSDATKRTLAFRKKEYHQATRIITIAASSSIDLVRQICSREIGCASSDVKVPELISTPNESSASITTIAGQNRNGNPARNISQ